VRVIASRVEDAEEGGGGGGGGVGGGGYKPIDFSRFSGRDSFKAPSDYDPNSVCNSPTDRSLHPKTLNPRIMPKPWTLDPKP
jgi:hypothetical protein